MMRKPKMISGLLREISFIAITWNPESNCTCRTKNHFLFHLMYGWRKYWWLLERWWRNRIIKCMDRLHKIYFIGGETARRMTPPPTTTTLHPIFAPTFRWTCFFLFLFLGRQNLFFWERREGAGTDFFLGDGTIFLWERGAGTQLCAALRVCPRFSLTGKRGSTQSRDFGF